MPCDRNLIQLQKRGVWHYWNFGSMMPVCGAGEPDPDNALIPESFATSMRASYIGAKRITKLCPDCVRIAKEGEGQ